MQVDRRQLYAALKELVRVAPSKAATPALEMVHLAASDGLLTAATTDLTRRLSCQLPAEGDLDVCVHGKLLSNVIKPEGRGDAGVVEIVRDSDKVNVLADGLISHLHPTTSVDFPVCPAPKKSEPWSLVAMWPAAPLKDALSFVLPAASRDEARAHLCTVLLADSDVVTTDGHRLHLARLPAPVPHPLLLRAPAAATLTRMLAHGDQVILARAGEVLRIKVGTSQLDTRLSDARFPPHQQVIPDLKAQPVHVRLQAKLLSRALSRVSRLTRDKRLRFQINGAITLTTWESDEGGAEIEVPVESSNHEGDDLKIGFDSPYLTQAIPGGTQEISLGFGGPLDPLRMDLEEGKLAVVMPLRLS